MKQHIFPAIRLTVACAFIFIGLYTLVISGIAQAFPAKGNGEKVMVNGKTVGYALEGQNFSQDRYFWSRPSVAGYNAAGSAGSNKGPSNPDYLTQVSNRIDSFIAHNRGIEKTAIPAEMVTASGSGLDPDLSPAGARIQVKRIAAVRHISKQTIDALVDQSIAKPLLGMFGTAKVNVLQLNIAFDKLSTTSLR